MNRRAFSMRFLGMLVAVALWIVACQPQAPSPDPAAPDSGTDPAAEAVFLNGTGASFPFFLYDRWFTAYNELNPNVQINYQPTGSEVGIQQIISGTIDFGASDVAMTEEDAAQVSQGVVLLPMTGGSVAIAYNLPGIESGLQLSREALPAIFSGDITNWNDPRLAEANPDLNLPDLPIILVHRSDGSGTTAALTRHLSAISPAWEEAIGFGLNVPWPTGVAIKANAGVSAQIQQASGTIGYVEYAYAQQLGMAVAALENQTGDYVLPDLDATAIALNAIDLPDSLVAFNPDPAAPGAYPVSTYTWIMAYQQYDDAAKADAIKALLQWCLSEGQELSADLGYVPLSEEVASRALEAVAQIQS